MWAADVGSHEHLLRLCLQQNPPHLTLLLYLPRVFMVCVAGLSGLTGFPSPFFIPLGRPRPFGAASGMLILLLLTWYELWLEPYSRCIYDGKRGMGEDSPCRWNCPIIQLQGKPFLSSADNLGTTIVIFGIFQIKIHFF